MPLGLSRKSGEGSPGGSSRALLHLRRGDCHRGRHDRRGDYGTCGTYGAASVGPDTRDVVASDPRADSDDACASGAASNADHSGGERSGAHTGYATAIGAHSRASVEYCATRCAAAAHDYAARRAADDHPARRVGARDSVSAVAPPTGFCHSDGGLDVSVGWVSRSAGRATSDADADCSAACCAATDTGCSDTRGSRSSASYPDRFTRGAGASRAATHFTGAAACATSKCAHAGCVASHSTA